MENKSSCLYCKKPLSGRADKKFCSDPCRSEYNNRKHREADADGAIQRINKILIQNRHILTKFIENNNVVQVDKERLILNGFHFNFYTHTVKVKESIKYFCYDIGYIRKGNKEIIIYNSD